MHETRERERERTVLHIDVKMARTSLESVIGEYWQLVTVLQMNRLSLRNNWLKFMTAGYLPIVLEEFIKYTTPI